MDFTRRQIFKTGAGLMAGGLMLSESGHTAASGEQEAASRAGSVIGMNFERKDVVRFGIIGVGQRGSEGWQEGGAKERGVLDRESFGVAIPLILVPGRIWLRCAVAMFDGQIQKPAVVLKGRKIVVL